MELLTDDIPDFMTPTAPTEKATPDQPAQPVEAGDVDLATLQGRIALEVETQLQTRAVGFANEGRIVVRSPKGFTMTLITRKETPGEVLAALAAMESWCLSSGYQPI